MEFIRGMYSAIPLLINLVLASAVIFLERKNIGTTWAWLMVLLFIPGLGFLLYLLFGQNLSKRKIYKVQEAQQNMVNALVDTQKSDLLDRQIKFQDPLMVDYQEMIYMNLSYGYSFFNQDNDVQIFTDGHKKFDALINSIEAAQHHVHLMYYIVHDDGLGRRLVNALARKAQEGVQVRFLYDDVGSVGLSKELFKPLLAAGGEIAVFFPSYIPYLNIRVNNRNHRKLAIIDGKEGYIGGFNVGDEYLGLDKRYGYWRDTHLLIKGSSVHQMQAQFMMDWDIASTNKLTNVRISNDFYPLIEKQGTVGIQILASGPDNELEQIKNAYIKGIHLAKDSIYLQTPYFIPDESLLNAIKLAAMSGLDVKLMIPSVPDHKMVYWATYSYLGDLLEVGAKVYLYEKGFLHAKTMVVDGKLASVGTANIDIRSFKLNFEVNAFIYDSVTSHKLKQIFEEDMLYCRELTLSEYQNRSRIHYLKESLTRLLSPIL
jgi:cardiolipin synthase A/B